MQSAQRLSASSEDSRRVGHTNRRHIRVRSTPFGIIGRLPHAALAPVSRLFFVLNAFRHHRKTHARRSRRYLLANLVLNAFRHHRKTHKIVLFNEKVCFMCSTPFGSIGRLTLTVGSLDHKFTIVLNAFRHHRKTHYSRGSHPSSAGNVLNAFRHHRKTHVGGGVALQPFFRVLNAFRHHRKTHCPEIGSMIVTSTRAQRLSASSEDSQPNRNRSPSRCQVCSTPFGIIGRLTLSNQARILGVLSVLN